MSQEGKWKKADSAEAVVKAVSQLESISASSHAATKGEFHLF
jgi:hypothetical protein